MLFKDLMNDKKESRVWWCSNGNTTHYYLDNDDKTIDNAIMIINALSIRELEDESIDFNASGLEIFEDNEWCEYYNDMGKDIKDIIDEREEENE